MEQHKLKRSLARIVGLQAQQEEKRAVRKAVIVLATAAVALNVLASPSAAEARGGYWRGGIGPAVAGGLIAGAVIGGLASSAYAFAPDYGYYGARPYYGPPIGYAAPVYYGHPYYYRSSEYGGQPQPFPYP
jgi:hypothetical protein